MRFARTFLLISATLAAMLGAGVWGCDEPGAASRYSVVVGDVVSRPDEFGEMTVSVVRRGGQDISGETLHCTITSDAELYVDDRFCPPSAIRPGDRIELIGYRDPNPAIDRFVVTLAEIERSTAAQETPNPPPPPARFRRPDKEP